MKKSIVISVLGNDSPGLVESLSKIIVAHEGEWIESRMASLAGKFAGILRIDLPATKVRSFQIALQNAENLGLSVIFEESVSSQRTPVENQFEIELIGQDQPGIVHRISSALAQMHANVDELHTEVIEASMSGESLFKANIKLHIASDVKSSEIRELLEDLANELIVDIELLEADA
ncbi:glycine cleavage system protein R [Thiomicrorhabdus lithotrophica]|uniref:Glycine cleavage system transcriptional repressor n=1 Tax=Thiomicrorhabdus lithotrophica TaxID=2949997 RepID=A0ABY8CD58_9GAMM|nr:ACT domain-containing protein [Thiomicrorhabdus lithotrophica]WEJ63417.1 ACT domain protein [Thiomicrorhabdus lithotrophica]